MLQVFSILLSLIKLKSISSSAEYVVTLQKWCFHIQVWVGILLFCNPTHKTETGTAKQTGEGGVLIANHLDQSL
jgi:hypothetical protein